MPTPADRIAATFKDHPEIQVHLTLVDELDDEDAAMVEQVVEYVGKMNAWCMASQNARSSTATPPGPYSMGRRPARA